MDKQSFLCLRKLHGKVNDSIVLKKRKIKLKKSEKYLKRIKGFHKGERCFIVGNGPSLNTEDLELLQNEICFGVHRIYKLFDKTTWRPTYYCAQDQELILSSYKSINCIQVKKKFIGVLYQNTIDVVKDSVFLRFLFDDKFPSFSSDISLGFYEGYTVTYMCIQIAVFMGFKDIYLLGMDHIYSTELSQNGTVIYNDGIKDHFDSEDVIENIPQPIKSTQAYKKALEYCENIGVSIYNATRGGKLEVFERKSIDKIFNQ